MFQTGVVTGSLGVNIDQYGVDYYYGWGNAVGVHAGVSAGMTTDTLSHTDTITTSAPCAARCRRRRKLL